MKKVIHLIMTHRGHEVYFYRQHRVKRYEVAKNSLRFRRLYAAMADSKNGYCTIESSLATWKIGN